MRAEYKVHGGKLVAAEAHLVQGHIVGVKITGDFFMHPEEAIIDLENTITGITQEELDSTINRFFTDRNIILFGVTPSDFAHVVRLSLEPT